MRLRMYAMIAFLSYLLLLVFETRNGVCDIHLFLSHAIRAERSLSILVGPFSVQQAAVPACDREWTANCQLPIDVSLSIACRLSTFNAMRATRATVCMRYGWLCRAQFEQKFTLRRQKAASVSFLQLSDSRMDFWALFICLSDVALAGSMCSSGYALCLVIIFPASHSGEREREREHVYVVAARRSSAGHEKMYCDEWYTRLCTLFDAGQFVIAQTKTSSMGHPILWF